MQLKAASLIAAPSFNRSFPSAPLNFETAHMLVCFCLCKFSARVTFGRSTIQLAIYPLSTRPAVLLNKTAFAYANVHSLHSTESLGLIRFHKVLTTAIRRHASSAFCCTPSWNRINYPVNVSGMVSIHIMFSYQLYLQRISCVSKTLTFHPQTFAASERFINILSLICTFSLTRSRSFPLILWSVPSVIRTDTIKLCFAFLCADRPHEIMRDNWDPYRYHTELLNTFRQLFTIFGHSNHSL